MLLTAEEYRRGFVKWAADTEATVAVVTDENGREITSSRMSDPSGSIPDIEPGNFVWMNMLANNADAPLGYYRLSWDRCLRDGIVAILLGGPIGEVMLTGIPALGRFDRLVLSVPYLQWGDGWVVRVGDVVVRFTDVVQFEGFQTDSVEHRGRESTIIQTFSTQQHEGSFIEIVAPETMNDRREIGFAIVGLLALVFGDIAIGDIVHRDVLDSTPVGTEYAVTTPLHAIPSAPNQALRMPIQPPIEWMQEFDQLLARFVEEAEVLADTALALRWYERAARTGGNVDRFLAAFVGLESLVGARGRRVGVESPIADLLRDSRVSELLQPLRDDYPDDQVDRLIERLQNRNLSLIDQFDVVAASLGLDDDHKAIFRRANGVRNPLVHGRDGMIDDERTREALSLLQTMLRAALNTQDA